MKSFLPFATTATTRSTTAATASRQHQHHTATPPPPLPSPRQVFQLSPNMGLEFIGSFQPPLNQNKNKDDTLFVRTAPSAQAQEPTLVTSSDWTEEGWINTLVLSNFSGQIVIHRLHDTNNNNNNNHNSSNKHSHTTKSIVAAMVASTTSLRTSRRRTHPNNKNQNSSNLRPNPSPKPGRGSVSVSFSPTPPPPPPPPNSSLSPSSSTLSPQAMADPRRPRGRRRRFEEEQQAWTASFVANPNNNKNDTLPEYDENGDNDNDYDEEEEIWFSTRGMIDFSSASSTTTLLAPSPTTTTHRSSALRGSPTTGSVHSHGESSAGVSSPVSLVRSPTLRTSPPLPLPHHGLVMPNQQGDDYDDEEEQATNANHGHHHTNTRLLKPIPERRNPFEEMPEEKKDDQQQQQQGQPQGQQQQQRRQQLAATDLLSTPNPATPRGRPNHSPEALHHHRHDLGGIIKTVFQFKNMKRSIPEEIRIQRRALRRYQLSSSYHGTGVGCDNEEPLVSTAEAIALQPPIPRPLLSGAGARGTITTKTHGIVPAADQDGRTTTTTTTTSSSTGDLAIVAATAAAAAASNGNGLPPTLLHELCARSWVSLEELWTCYNKSPEAIRIQDSRGRYPLHILSNNETLLSASPSGQQTATVFASHLMNEYPAAMTTMDKEGFLPFFYILSDWILWAHDQHKLKEDYTARSDLDEEKSFCYPGSSARRVLFPRVEIWEEAEWCFAMLSTELDILGRNAALPTYQASLLRAAYKTSGTKRDDRTILVEKLVDKLPRLLPTLLLVEDDGVDSRSRALEMAVFRRMLLCPKVVGRWLIHMLNYGGVPAQRAVDFLWKVSHTTIDDYTGGVGSALRSDWRNFETSRQKVFDEISDLKGVIATLVTLKSKEMERAASTPVIWHAMGNKLSRPFVLGLVLIDLVLHITLMATFRDEAGVKPSLPETHHQRVLVGVSVIYIICTHYLLRMISESWAMWAVSTGAFRGYMLDMWNIFGFNAIILTAITTLLNGNDSKSRNGLNAFVIGLLWIKVLAFLKVVNKDMATFILALSQILFDIRFFLLVLAVCVFMFGDMFHLAVSEKGNGTFCENNPEYGAMEDFCASSWESYLRVYAILVGDIQLDDLTQTPGTVILFVLFTLFGVIILLNVLIAIISDSYEKATLRGQILFGRARVMFVAQNEALENFLKPRKRQHRTRRNRTTWTRLMSVGRWSVLSAILTTALFTESWLVSTIGSLVGSTNSKDITYCVFALILSTLLGAALWVVATFLLDDVFRWVLPDRTECLYDALGRFNNSLVRRISSFLFGLEREKVETVSQHETTEQEWTGRINYMEQVMSNLIADVRRDIKAEMMELKSEIHKTASYVG
ncbi:hypothetical protein ACA910_022723 [Epithemia clementina (nom. ined.)]